MVGVGDVQKERCRGGGDAERKQKEESDKRKMTVKGNKDRRDTGWQNG